MESEWWATFFTGPYLGVYKYALSEESTWAEVDISERLLRMPSRGHLLDVPCGNGRHSIEFAKRGYVVSGIDFAAPLLDQARQEAEAAHLKITWHQGDMRDLPWTHIFDGAICLGSSFGYLDDKGNQAFVEAVARTLKPGARFVLETPTVETVFHHFNLREHRWTQRDNLLVLDEWKYDFRGSRLKRNYTYVHVNAAIQQQQMSVRLYTYRELCQLLETAGFEEFNAYDAETKQPFSVSSLRLLLVMTRNIQ